MNTNTSSLRPLLIASFILVLPYLVFLFAWPYQVSAGDEARQILASIQMLKGNGYISSLYPMQLDLSVQPYSYLTFWPIGYSALIYALLQLGFTPSFAAALLQAVTVVVSFFAWSLCASLLFSGRWLALAFLGFLGMHFFSWGNYNTAAFSWGAMGFLTWWIVRWSLYGKPTSRFLFLAVNALLISWLIVLRFQNVTFIPAILGYYLVDRYRKDHRIQFGAWIKDSFVLCLLPTITFALIMLTNKWWGEFASPTQFGAGVLGLTPVEALTKWVSGFLLGGSFRIDEILPGLVARFGGNLSLIEHGLDIASCLVFALVIWFIYRHRKQKGPLLAFEWFLWSYICLVAMFAYIAFVYNQNYTVGHTRYFHYLVPGFVLPLLAIVASIKPRLVKPMAVVFLALGLLVAAAFMEHRRALHAMIEKKAEAVLPKLDELRRQYPDHAIFIAVDSLFPVLVLKDYPNLNLWTKPLLQGGNYFSRPTLVVVIRDDKPVKEMYEPLANVDKVIARYGLRQEPAGENMSFFWGVLPAGPAPKL